MAAEPQQDIPASSTDVHAVIQDLLALSINDLVQIETANGRVEGRVQVHEASSPKYRARAHIKLITGPRPKQHYYQIDVMHYRDGHDDPTSLRITRHGRTKRGNDTTTTIATGTDIHAVDVVGHVTYPHTIPGGDR